jgi:hypothetical protein
MMRADCQRCREALDDFLSSELLIETSQDVLRHANGCAECRAELERRQGLRDQLKRVLDRAPGPSLESRILDALSTDRSPQLSSHPPDVVRGSAFEAGGTGPLISRSPRDRDRAKASEQAGRRRRAHPGIWTPGWRQAAGVAAVCVVVLSAVWVATEYGRLSAAELLSKSRSAERTTLATPDMALHRVMSVDERLLPAGTLVSRHRVDQWRDGRTGVTIRRTYDNADQLIAGEWVDPDRKETVFARGASPKSVTPVPLGARAAAVLESGQAWRIGLSAEEFATLIPDGAEARVRAVANGYELSYASPSAPTRPGIRRASMTLRRPDLRPVHQLLEVRRAEQSYEYQWVEQQFATVPSSQVRPEIFEPDMDLAALEPGADPAPDVAPAPALPARAAVPSPARSTVRSSPVIDVLYRLHRIDACLWGDVDVRFLADGRVEAVVRVPDEARRTQAQAALTGFAGTLDPTIDIRVTDALPVEASPPAGPAAGALTDLPAYGPLRRYFQADLARRVPQGAVPAEALDAAIDGAIGRMADRVVHRATTAGMHAAALRGMIDTFPTPRPEGADLTAAATWQTMLRDHARGFVRETEAIRLELQPVFLPALDLHEPRPDAEVPEDRPLVDIVDEVLARARAHERAVRASFSAPAPTIVQPSVAAEDFWRSLLRSERLGLEFERPWILDERPPAKDHKE